MTEERKKMSKGCMVALIIVGALIVIFIISMIVCYIYKDELVGFGLDKMTEAASTEIKKDLPEGYTADGVDSLMAEFKIAFKEEKINQNELQEISSSLQDIVKPGNYTPDKGKEFLQLMRSAIDEQ